VSWGVQPLQAGDPERIGRFLLRGRLGAGGMGRVYLGVSPDGTPAAIKVIRDELAGEPGFRQRFRREVAAATAVAGMFTARVLDADPEAHPPWLATQFVDGPTLLDAVRDGGPLSEANQRRLARELAEALSAIHAAGLVHRDLKPANVMLCPTGAKVIDFGIAQAVDATRLTTVGSILGTPEYMAPEQVMDPAGSGPPADVFALGATVAFAATGRSPFATDQPASTLYRIVNLEPELVGAPPATAATVRACLAKDPAQRPTSAVLAARLRDDRPTVPAPTRVAELPMLPPQPHHQLHHQPPPPAPAPARPRSWPIFVSVAVVLVMLVLVVLAARARTTPGAAPPTSTSTATPAAEVSGSPAAAPDSPQARYVDRLCASGKLLATLGSSATAPQATGDPAVARRDFLAALDRSIGTVDVALADFTALRDEAPTAEIRTRFGLVVDEFTRAKQSFTKARATVAASDPLTVAAYKSGIGQFADGVRNLAFAAQLIKDIELPPDYTAASASAPRCTG
jgi:serine/threonine protein kinase